MKKIKMIEDLEKACSELFQTDYVRFVQTLFKHRLDWENAADDLRGVDSYDFDVTFASAHSLALLCGDLGLEEAYEQFKRAALSSHS